jgi:hypothetical protein
MQKYHYWDFGGIFTPISSPLKNSMEKKSYGFFSAMEL